MTPPVRALPIPAQATGIPRVPPVGLALLVALALLLVGADLEEKALLEREATLALAAQGRSWGVPAAETSPPLPVPLPVVAATRASMRLLGPEEPGIRAVGALAGGLAIGATFALGTRLFVPSVGAVTALLLLLFRSTRPLIGAVAGVEPWALLLALVGIDATWRMRDRREAAPLAGLAAGALVAVSGVSGSWLLLFALTWLWRGKGLNPRSALILIGTAAAGLLGTLVPAALATGRALGEAFATLRPSFPPQSPGSLLDLCPLFYPLVLGAIRLPRGTWRTTPIRFVELWLVFAAASILVGGPVSPALVAALLVTTAISVWGLRNSTRRLALGVVCLVLASSFAITAFRRSTVDAEEVDRWAAREAARFVRNVLPGIPEEVATDRRIRARIAHYADRPVAGWLPRSGLPPEVRFVVLDREAVRTRTDTSSAEDWALQPRLPALFTVAEFGRWTIARTTSGPRPPVPTRPPGGAPAPSSDLRLEKEKVLYRNQ